MRDVCYVIGLEDRTVHYINTKLTIQRTIDRPRVMYAKQRDVDAVWDVIVKNLEHKFISQGLILANATIISILTVKQGKIQVIEVAE